MVGGRDRGKTVAVLRLQLFKTSEPFIASQVRLYRDWRPLLLGRTRHGPDPGVADVALARAGSFADLRTMLTRHPSALLRALDGRRPDLVHAHFAVDGVYALALARHLRVPLVTTLHGFDVTLRPGAMLASGRVPLVQSVLARRRLQRRGQLFLAVSDDLRRQAIARGFPPGRTHTLHLGVDLERIVPDGRPPEADLVVHVGRLVEKKGAAVLLRAFRQLAGERPQARLEIVGDGPLRARLEAEARRLDLQDRVRFHGVLAHIETLRVISRASVLAVPSLTAATGDAEGLPTVVLEAAALGRPVVASRTAGLPEAVEDGRTGFLTPQGDAQALARCLQLLLDRPELGAGMGEAGRRLMQARFDACRQTARLEGWYDRLLLDQPRSAAG